MKSLVKKVKGILKLSALSIPALITAGGVAGLVGTLTVGLKSCDSVREEIRNSEIFQEIIEDEQNILKANHENGTLSVEDYNSQMSYIKSNDFIEDILKSNENLAEYEKKYTDAQNLSISSLFYVIPLVVGVFLMIGVYTTEIIYYIDDNLGQISKKEAVAISAKKDFEEAKKIKELKIQQKEMKDYKEEIL